jgi:Tol biopolymer transport system component
MRKLLPLFFVLGLFVLAPLIFFGMQQRTTTSASHFFTPYADITTQPSQTIQQMSGRILFVSDRTGNREIYFMDLSTRQTINLTNSPKDDMNPQVSSDGRYMVFYSNRNGDNDIFKLDLQTSELTQLTTNSNDDYDPSFSPDGKQIVFKSTRTDKLGDIFIMNADGTKSTNLTRSRRSTEEWDPAFSLDGSKIIFTVRTNNDHKTDELYVMDKDGGNLSRLTDNSVADWYPSLSPKDGAMIFISTADKSTKEDIFRNNLDGVTGNTRLTHLPGNDADPAWDFTGNHIIFINDQDGDYDLYIMNADGSDVQKVSDTKADELSPIFLP